MSFLRRWCRRRCRLDVVVGRDDVGCGGEDDLVLGGIRRSGVVLRIPVLGGDGAQLSVQEHRVVGVHRGVGMVLLVLLVLLLLVLKMVGVLNQ